MNTPLEPLDLNRRNFLRGGSLASLAAILGNGRARAQDQKKEVEKAVTAVPTAVIGLGNRGREAVNLLQTMSNATVAAVCDNYAPSLKRTANVAPKAKAIANYQEILADKSIKAVVITTPSHLHREIAIAALEAGKHVYCEAPLASSIEDARAIAAAARKYPRQVFQPGLQERSHPQSYFLLPFIRSGAAGTPLKASSQWHKKMSWRMTSPNADREKALNWRLDKELSPGLIGEIAIHHIDSICWFLGVRPKAVRGFGSLIAWKDGREVPDTVEALFEFPNGARYSAEVTLGNSFDGEYQMIYGTDAAVMMRENKAWMFKEADSPLLGWEVYARKDSFYKESGIALVANATKIVAQGSKPAEESPYPNPPMFYALEAFHFNAHEITTGIEDFTANFGDDDPKALAEHLSKLTLLPAPGWKEGYEATVLALKANEAVMKGERIEFRDEWFHV